MKAHGFIGERYDPSTGLQYLNARYYDVRLGMFIQPDWFEVTEPGVGTNRYAYSFNDPVNGSDPGGNLTIIVKGTDVEDDDESYRPGSEFLRAVSDTFEEETTVAQGVMGNYSSQREAMANTILEIVMNHEFSDGELLNVVTHSHGRQAALLYTRLQGARSIDNLVTLNGPVREVVSGNYAMVRNHIQAYNRNDPVAPRAGGEDGPTWQWWKYAPAGLVDPRRGVTNVDITYYPSAPKCPGCQAPTDNGQGVFAAHNGVDPLIWRHYIDPTLRQIWNNR